MTDRAQLERRLEELEVRFDDYRRQFAADGRTTRSERQRLDRLHEQIVRCRRELAEQGVTAMPGMEMTAETLPYTDRSFKSIFEQSVREWCSDAQIYLNSVQGYFNSPEPAEGLGVSDVLSVLELAFSGYPPAAAVIGTVNTVQAVVQNAYRSALPRQPSLAQIHDAWSTALSNYGRSGNKQPAFEAFIADYKRRERIPASNDQAVVGIFTEACRSACEHFPSREHVQRAFLTGIVRNVPDRPLDGEDYAGVAEVELLELAGNFSRPSGQIDDVNEPLMNALQTVWGRERVINLPIPIIFTMRNVNNAATAVFRRDSNQPGNTSFRMERGEQAVFDAFMSERAYNIPRVPDLTYDSGP